MYNLFAEPESYDKIRIQKEKKNAVKTCVDLETKNQTMQLFSK